MTIRVRFAPSPTGYLHIGGARTALFNWLFARHHGGEFVIRVEDTDTERSTEESTRSIFEALEWMGLNWDGEPLVQSTRRDEHTRLALELLDKGLAYKCYATPEELEEMKATAKAEGRQPKYDRRWRDGGEPPSPDAPWALRFKMPLHGSTTIDDQVLGPVTVNHEELDDVVILRRDGTPTYNFVVVCDDAFMGITHVIRGQDHMTNTFRQAQIYRALDHELPVFGHLPLVDGLSKRKGSLSVQHYRDTGFLVEAVNNYIARLGWSHGDQELFSLKELVDLFDLDGVNRSSGTYDETKMTWVNTEWLRRLSDEELGERLVPFLSELGIDAAADPRMPTLAGLYRERAETLKPMAESMQYFFRAPEEYNAKAKKKWVKANSKPAFEGLVEELSGLDDFTTEAVADAIQKVLTKFETKMVKVAQPTRVAISGASATPSLDATLAALGKDESVARMRALLPHFPEPAN